MKQGTNGERSLANRLTSEGFFTTRAAGSGSAQRAQADLVAINEDAILIIECKTYKDGSGVIDLADDKAQLDEIRGMVVGDFPGNAGERDVHAIVAFKEDGSSMWYFTRPSFGKIDPDDDHTPLFKLLNRYR